MSGIIYIFQALLPLLILHAPIFIKFLSFDSLDTNIGLKNSIRVIYNSISIADSAFLLSRRTIKPRNTVPSSTINVTDKLCSSTIAMDINDYVFINRFVLKFAGLYPVNIVRYVLCISCLFLIIVPQVAQIYENWRDLTILLETSSVLFTILLALLKSLVWIFNKRNIEPFIKYMFTNYWDLAASTDAFSHFEVYATYAKKVTKGYVFLICNALLFFFSLPIVDLAIAKYNNTTLNRRKHFPFLALYPKSYYEFPLYELAYISQIMATSICGLIIIATDTFIATAVLHTCGQFKVVQRGLSHLNCRHAEYSSKLSTVRVQTIKLQMAQIIKYHQMLLWFSDNMEKNFSPMLLLQTLASTLIICLVGLQVSTKLTERSQLIQYFSYLIMAMFQLLLFCLPGDILSHESFAVSKVAYAIEWHEFATPLKTELCMIISRAQKSCYITAGGFYMMHLENFNAVLSTAVSYFMTLRSFNVEK